MIKALRSAGRVLALTTALTIGSAGYAAAEPVSTTSKSESVTAMTSAEKASAAAMMAAYPTCNTRYLGQTRTYSAWMPHHTSGTSACVLGSGNSGTAVSTLQTSLVRCWQRNIAVDGQYGAATRESVRAVQAYMGITQDGVWGPSTADRFVWWTTSSTCDSRQRTP